MLREEEHFTDNPDIINLPVISFPHQLDPLRSWNFFCQKTIKSWEFASSEIRQIYLCIHFDCSDQTFSQIKALFRNIHLNKQILLVYRSGCIRLNWLPAISARRCIGISVALYDFNRQGIRLILLAVYSDSRRSYLEFSLFCSLQKVSISIRFTLGGLSVYKREGRRLAHTRSH